MNTIDKTGRELLLKYLRYYYNVRGWHVMPKLLGEKHTHLAYVTQDNKGHDRYTLEFLEKEIKQVNFIDGLVLRTGQVNNANSITGIDYDPRNDSANKKGKKIIDELIACEDWLIADTPGEGCHIFCQYDPEIKIVGLPDTGIEFKFNHLMVLPPSWNKERTGKYKFKNPKSPIIALTDKHKAILGLDKIQQDKQASGGQYDSLPKIWSKEVQERFDALKQVLGENFIVKGDEYICPCICCREEGGDTDGNHFSFNVKKNKYRCFANNDHTKSISEKVKELLGNRKTKKKAKEEPGEWQVQLLKVVPIPEDEKDFWSLEKKIKDPDKIVEKYNLLWCENNKTILKPHGERYKLMPLDGRSYKWDIDSNAKITPGFIEVTPCTGQKSLLLLEGLNNLFALATLASDEFNQEFYTVTSVHGVSSTLGLDKEINFNKFENIVCCLDNDDAGNAEAKLIKEKYPNAHIINL